MIEDNKIVRTEDWPKYAPFFSPYEFKCSKTGKVLMLVEFMDALLELRKEYAKPMIITSGYRDLSHPREAAKAIPGDHAYGRAADIACWSDEAFEIAEIAFRKGFTRIGVSQAPGKPRFIHLAISETPSVALYSY